MGCSACGAGQTWLACLPQASCADEARPNSQAGLGRLKRPPDRGHKLAVAAGSVLGADATIVWTWTARCVSTGAAWGTSAQGHC